MSELLTDAHHAYTHLGASADEEEWLDCGLMSKEKKTIKSNNKNLFRIFTCRNLDIYLDNFGCLLVEMSFIGDWSGPPV